MASPCGASSASPSGTPGTTRHLSLRQLQGEVARLQQLCPELRQEIEARWRLDGGRGGTRALSRRKPRSLVEHRALEVLGRAQGRLDVERIWLEHQELVQRSQEIQGRLQEELQGAVADVQQLWVGLPQLLEARSKELQGQRQRVEDLRLRKQEGEAEIEELRDELEELQLEASDLQGKAQSMVARHHQSSRLAIKAESEAEALQLQCDQVKQGTDAIHTTYPSRLEMSEHLRQEIPKLESQILQLEQLLAQQREKLQSAVQGQRLAQHLELQLLQRRVSLHRSRRLAKHEEITWLRRLAEALESELARRAAQRP